MGAIGRYSQPVISLISLSLGIVFFFSPLWIAYSAINEQRENHVEREFVIKALEARLRSEQTEFERTKSDTSLLFLSLDQTITDGSALLSDRCRTIMDGFTGSGVTVATPCRISASPLDVEHSLITAEISGVGAPNDLFESMNEHTLKDLAVSYFSIISLNDENSPDNANVRIRFRTVARNDEAAP